MPDFTYDDLFVYIKKNTKLPESVNAVDLESKSVKDLLQAIKKGDVNFSGYQNLHCQTYLLRLFKEKSIEPGEFLTVYSYTMAIHDVNEKMQSGLKVEELSLRQLVENSALTQHGKDYIASISKKFEAILKVNINIDELTQAILRLSPIEQTVIYLKSNFVSQESFELIRDNVPTIPTYGEEQGQPFEVHIKGNFIEPSRTEIRYESYPSFPSYSLEKYLIKKYIAEPLKSNPMEFAPAFGSLSEKGQYELQKKNKRVYVLYHKDVKSNMLSAHNLHDGTFSVAKHDEGHIILASLMSMEMREKILYEDIPHLLKMKESIQGSAFFDKVPVFFNEVENTNQIRVKNVSNLLNHIIYDQLNDFTLFPIEDYVQLNNEERRKKFIFKALSWVLDNNLYYINIKNNEQIDLIYLILLEYHTGRNKEYWEILSAGHPYLLDNIKIKEIDEEAKKAAGSRVISMDNQTKKRKRRSSVEMFESPENENIEEDPNHDLKFTQSKK